MTKPPSVVTVTQSPAAAASLSASAAAGNPDYTKKYVEAVYSNDATSIANAQRYAAPNSPAEAYRRYLGWVSEADLDNGQDDSTTVSVTSTAAGAAWKACDNDNNCIVYGDFKVNSSGQVADMSIAGKTIDDRITLGDGRAVTSEGVSATFLAAYSSPASGRLYVVMRIATAGTDAYVSSSEAIYRSPSGAQRQANDDASGRPEQFGKDSNALIYAGFESVKFGGTVHLEGCVPQSCNGRYSLTIETR